MMAFILATDFDFIAYMSKMAFFGSFFSRQWRFWNMMCVFLTNHQADEENNRLSTVFARSRDYQSEKKGPKRKK